MTTNKVDQVLKNWADRWDWTPQNRKPKGLKTTTTGIRIPHKPHPNHQPSAQTTKANLKAFTRQTPQVIVKISGGAKGLSKVMQHLSYISRGGQLPLEDQDGEKIEEKDGLKDLRLAWGKGGYPIPEESDKREAIHIVLSMPEGTDELAVLKAARDFAKAEFSQTHDYVMALHTFATDPGPKPSKHPHVHLAVKSRGFDGTRLNPRKADLQDWRESFARALRENGIEAIATRRRTRLKQEKGEPQATRHMKARGVTPRNQATARPQPKATERAKQNTQEALNDYKTIAETLAQSPASEDRKLATDLVQTLRELNARARTTQER